MADEQKNTPDDRGFSEAPRYPTPDYYNEIARQAWNKYDPPPAATRGIAHPAGPPRLRAHNAFSRFIIAWGGWQRFWISIGSAVLSVIVYSTYLSTSGNSQQALLFGLGLVLLICVHELGHAFTLRLKKLPATFPIFIPGVGAFVSLPNQPISVRDQADISLAGPFLGGVGSLVCMVIFLATTYDPLWTHLLFDLAEFGFLLNMINLIPVLPLDGGHIGNTLSRWFAPAGLGIIALLYFYLPSLRTFMLFIGVIGLAFTFQTFNSPVRRVIMRQADRVTVAVMYAVVTLALFGGFWVTFLHPEVLFTWYLRLHGFILSS